MNKHSPGWVCTDCLMILANGEDNPEWSEAEAENHHANMHRHIDNFIVTIGGEHEPYCENVEWTCAYSLCHSGSITEDNRDDDCISGLGHDPVYLAWKGDTDCYCETIDFSSRSCSTCGTSLGGSRHAVTFWNPSKLDSDGTFTEDDNGNWHPVSN